MKKKIIGAVLVLIAVLAVLAIIIFEPFSKSENPDNIKSNVQVYSVDKDSIIGIDVNTGDDYYELVKSEDGVWSFKGVEGVSVIQPKADGIAYDIANLYVEGTVEENAQDYKKYGLEPAFSTVVIHLSDGSMRTFLLGSLIQDSTDRYFATDDAGRNVLRISAGKCIVMQYKKEDLISTSMQEIYKGDISEITLSRNDGYTFKIKQNLDSPSEEWIVTDPFVWKTDTALLQKKVLNFVVGLTALEYVEDLSDAEMGLDKPRVSVSVLKTDGTTQNFYVGNTVGNGAYIRVDGVKNPAIIDGEIVKLAQVTAFDVISKLLQPADYYTIKNVKLEGDLDVNLNYKKSESTVNGNALSDEEAIRLYSAICNLKIDAEAPSIKKGALRLNATFTYANSQANYKVYEYDDRNYTVTCDGNTYFLIRKDTYNTWKESVKLN